MAGVHLAGSTWGYFVDTDPDSWGRMSDAVRSILDLDLGLGVEVWATRGFDDPPVSGKEMGALADVCAAAPFLSVHARGAYWTWDPKGLREEIAFAAAIGAGIVVVHPGSLGMIGPDARIDQPEIRRLGQMALDQGVLFALENTQDAAWALDRLLDELGDDPQTSGFGICIDVGHAHISGDLGRHPIRAYLRRYRGPLRHVHLHDTYDERDRHLVLGNGTINWVDVFRVLDDIGYARTAVFEVHDPDAMASDAIRASERIARSIQSMK